MPERLRKHGPLAGVLLLAAALNFYGLDWGIASLRDFRLDGRRISFAGANFHPDSNTLACAAGSLNVSPFAHEVRDGKVYLFSTYGPVFMYLYWGCARAAGGLFGFTAFDDAPRNADATRLVGRALSALLGLSAVWLTYLLGARCFGRAAGLLAAFLLAVTPMAVQAAHMATVDGALAAGAAWICYHAVDIAREGRLRSYLWCGLALGVALATKVNALPLAAAPAVAHVLFARGALKAGPTLRRLWGVLADRRIYVMAGCALDAYLLLTPAALLRFEDYFLTEFYGNIFHVLWLNITGAETDMMSYVQRGSLYLEGAPVYLYHFTDVFPGGLGWPLEVAAVLGFLYACYRRTPESLVLAATALLYFLVIGRLWDRPIRYIVPLGPLFAVLAARMLVDGCLSVRRPVRIAAIAAAVLLCGYTLTYTAAFAAVYGMPDSRVQAARWMQEQIPAEAVVILERGHNSLATLISPDRRILTMDIEQEMYNTLHDALAENGDYTACFETEYLSGADYLLISDDRLALVRYKPTAAHYYGALFDGKLGYTLVRAFEMRPRLAGMAFDDSNADLNCRRYDHPATYIFRRTGPAALYDEYPDLKVYLLQTQADCLEVFNRAVRLADFTLFRRVLPRKLRGILAVEGQMDLFRQFLTRPEMVREVQQPAAFAREDGVWRVNLQVDE